ncbi:MAG: VOC family protein, partial [Anaerolineales bacterium]|nr:VOC family protein [Anaerolineales bacterium]
MTTTQKTDFSLHPDVGVGAVTLTVANLENQIRFYQEALGLKLHSRDGNKATLGSD